MELSIQMIPSLWQTFLRGAASVTLGSEQRFAGYSTKVRFGPWPIYLERLTATEHCAAVSPRGQFSARDQVRVSRTVDLNQMARWAS